MQKISGLILSDRIQEKTIMKSDEQVKELKKQRKGLLKDILGTSNTEFHNALLKNVTIKNKAKELKYRDLYIINTNTYTNSTNNPKCKILQFILTEFKNYYMILFHLTTNDIFNSNFKEFLKNSIKEDTNSKLFNQIKNIIFEELSDVGFKKINKIYDDAVSKAKKETISFTKGLLELAYWLTNSSNRLTINTYKNPIPKTNTDNLVKGNQQSEGTPGFDLYNWVGEQMDLANKNELIAIQRYYLMLLGIKLYGKPVDHDNCHNTPIQSEVDTKAWSDATKDNSMQPIEQAAARASMKDEAKIRTRRKTIKSNNTRYTRRAMNFLQGSNKKEYAMLDTNQYGGAPPADTQPDTTVATAAVPVAVPFAAPAAEPAAAEPAAAAQPAARGLESDRFAGRVASGRGGERRPRPDPGRHGPLRRRRARGDHAGHRRCRECAHEREFRLPRKRRRGHLRGGAAPPGNGRLGDRLGRPGSRLHRSRGLRGPQARCN